MRGFPAACRGPARSMACGSPSGAQDEAARDRRLSPGPVWMVMFARVEGVAGDTVRLTPSVKDAPVLIDIGRATADRPHAVVVRGIAPALRVVELRPVVRLARLIGGVDARAQRLVGDSRGQRWPRVAGRAQSLHVLVVLRRS